MQFTSVYESPLGEITIASDEVGVTGLWFCDQKYFKLHLDKETKEKETEYINLAKKWLDIYFSGKEPGFNVPFHLIGTDFQIEVWKILCEIPYGKTITYGEIANILANRRGIAKMSAQAVGGAVGHNPISIIIPCHRVIGSDGNLTGYSGGINKKTKLLELEKALK